ncbi:MAG: aldehyde dehydrogenase family protein [Paracoccus sp. (in: a-proteobacteria)]|uniref:aldehyde dehydrogenase family protein n=1 Tax=Paracoccus sp. TaxID=267 RepID=UPI0039E2F91B
MCQDPGSRREYPAIIGGQPVMTAARIEVIDPAEGTVFAHAARCGADEVDQAVAAARQAYEGGWRLTTAAERARLLLRFSQVITTHAADLAALESRDTGKPLRQAKVDVAFAARYFEYYAHMVEAVFGAVIPAGTDRLTFTLREAHGVTGHVIPWNYPLGIACRTLAPALAAGNCCVLKPAEQAPLSSVRLAELVLEAGFPAGVLNVVPGLGAEAGAALSGHPGIDHISFTGSVPVGRMIATAAAQNLIPAALELGGKSPNIVLADANLDIAVPVVAQAILQNAGQTCSAGARLLVHRDVHDEVVRRLAGIFQRTSIGPGHADPDLGPVISALQHSRIGEMVETGRAEAELVTGGGRPPGAEYEAGYYFQPTLFDHVPPQAAIAQREIFGPVLAVTAFADLDEAVSLANGTDYGLVAGVWTRNIGRANWLLRELYCGQVMVNTFSNGVELPFGGRKKSGYGVEKGYDALLAFTHVKGAVVMMDKD